MQAERTSRKLHTICKNFLQVLSLEQVTKQKGSTKQHTSRMTMKDKDLT